MEAALEATNVIDAVSGDTLNAGAKGAARSRFESVKQRFFQQLLMSMKLPSLSDIGQMLELAETGCAPVNLAKFDD